MAVFALVSCTTEEPAVESFSAIDQLHQYFVSLGYQVEVVDSQNLQVSGMENPEDLELALATYTSDRIVDPADYGLAAEYPTDKASTNSRAEETCYSGDFYALSKEICYATVCLADNGWPTRSFTTCVEVF
ncbi:MAG TPA: hypothetical protein DCE41_08780 [Cytophagales bacterium]|nr:hypothetical protein [Cytophagales bacterium]HAA20136.1 hypothetical protein [Cytophagales bacterium]HAP59966.1 hypothetical protein [Cytophagales bacterium]